MDKESGACKMRHIEHVDRDISTSQNLQRIEVITERVGKILKEENYAIISYVLETFKDMNQKKAFIKMISNIVHDFWATDEMDSVINKLTRSYMTNMSYYGALPEVHLGYYLQKDLRTDSFFFAYNQIIAHELFRQYFK